MLWFLTIGSGNLGNPGSKGPARKGRTGKEGKDMSNGDGGWQITAEIQKLISPLLRLIRLLIYLNGAWSALQLLPLLLQIIKLLASQRWTWEPRRELVLRNRWTNLSADYRDLINQLLDLEKRKIAFLINGVLTPFKALQSTAQDAMRAIMN